MEDNNIDQMLLEEKLQLLKDMNTLTKRMIEVASQSNIDSELIIKLSEERQLFINKINLIDGKVTCSLNEFKDRFKAELLNISKNSLKLQELLNSNKENMIENISQNKIERKILGYKNNL